MIFFFLSLSDNLVNLSKPMNLDYLVKLPSQHLLQFFKSYKRASLAGQVDSFYMVQVKAYHKDL